MKTDNMKGGGTAVVRIPKELDDWLTDIAEQTGRTKTFYAREALERYLEDFEDGTLAMAAEKASEGKKRISLEDLERQLSMAR